MVTVSPKSSSTRGIALTGMPRIGKLNAHGLSATQPRLADLISDRPGPKVVRDTRRRLDTDGVTLNRRYKDKQDPDDKTHMRLQGHD